MPKLPKYSYIGPVDHTIPADKSKLVGKSVIITGGANGMGEQIARDFAAAGSFVTFGDLNVERGKKIEAELNGSGNRTHFVGRDIRSWDDQIRMFEAAISKSPNRSCDIVIANAGISRSSGDSLWKLDGECIIDEGKEALTLHLDVNAPPIKPGLNIMDVNITGILYTFKLAVHYFRKQPDSIDRDRCFIITGSMTTWIDSPVVMNCDGMGHC